MGSSSKKKYRGKDKLHSVLLSNEFRNDIKVIRTRYWDDPTIHLYKLIAKYGLLQAHFSVIEAAFYSRRKKKTAGTVLETSLEPVVQVINHVSRTVEPSDSPNETYRIAEAVGGFQSGLALHISSDASKDEIIDFIDENYSKLIKPGLQKYRRQYSEQFTERNVKIRADKAKGKNVLDIANDNNISVARVYQILKEKL